MGTATAKRSNAAPALSAALLAVPLLALGACGATAPSPPQPMSSYSVPSTSMAPNLNQGDVFLARGPKNVCQGVRPKIGDVVVIWNEQEAVHYVRRVVAGPGAVVQMRGGRLFVDGVAAKTEDVGPIDPAFAKTQQYAGPFSRVLRETLSNGASHLIIDLASNSRLDDTPEVKVPEDSWFLLGDNRDNAVDSRIDGPVPTRLICAVADKIFWSWRLERIGAQP
jgi:signal peptidase I